MPANPSRSRRKSKSGTVQVRNSNNRLQLVFTHGGKRHFVSPGLSDTPINRKIAQEKAFTIQRDIDYGEFDATYEKYKVQSALSTVDPVARIDSQSPQLANLWQQYVEYKRPNVSPKTINGTYEPVAAHMSRCSTDGLEDTIQFRQELLKVTTQGQARRTLMELSAACKWGMRHGLVQSNPFEGMYLELEGTEPAPPIAFSIEERDRIIAAFENHKGKGISYRHYAPLIKFLFWSGCRPCEVIGLRWGSVKPDCSRVHFKESMVEVSGRLERRTIDKTGVRRWFSCPAKLQALLQSLRPEKPDSDELVFKAPKGGCIRESNLNDRGWQAVLKSLDLAQKDGIKMTLYNCRDTFITLQAIAGHSSTTIARWVGNSSQVIEERYLDKMKLDHLRPTDV